MFSKKNIKASTVLGLDKGFHFYMEPEWENEINSYAKYPFWIGINDPNGRGTRPLNHNTKFL